MPKRFSFLFKTIRVDVAISIDRMAQLTYSTFLAETGWRWSHCCSAVGKTWGFICNLIAVWIFMGRSPVTLYWLAFCADLATPGKTVCGWVVLVSLHSLRGTLLLQRVYSLQLVNHWGAVFNFPSGIILLPLFYLNILAVRCIAKKKTKQVLYTCTYRQHHFKSDHQSTS